VYFARGHIKIALSAIDEALKFDPTDSYALNLRIELLKAKGDHKRARVAALEALEMNPENERAHALAGVLNLELRDRDCGISHLQEAVRLDPGVENVRRTYVEALEGSRPFARVIQAVRRELSEGVIEFGYICGTAWIVYLCLRQKEGTLFTADWPLLFIAVTIVLHLLLLVVWWGPFLLLVTVRDTHSFQVICGEFSFRDRTRFTRPWHTCLSLGIIFSVISLVLPGMYWAPLAAAFASLAIPLRMAELVSSRVRKFAGYLYAFVVTVIAFVWAFSPNALRFGKDVPNGILNYMFIVTTLVSVVLLAAVWQQAKQQRPEG
jgi:tetratricopeptide (TPR) repeat protein